MTPAPRIGTEFAGYRIEGLLGRGGMGHVYRAEHPRLGITLALKVMDPTIAMDEGFRERFVREARAAARIRHPNIISVYDAGEWHGDLYIAMRYVEGDDLKSVLKRDGALSLEQTFAIGLQIASALDAAHRSGLIHRDVKPGNILVEDGPDPDSGPIPYLADLGLTKQVDSRGGVTESGQLLGTIDYVAPEQISGTRVDGRADVYSLACVLFECLTGTVPYVRGNQAAVLWAHLHDEPPRASIVGPSLPESVDAALIHGMAKSPEDRFKTCRELVTALDAPLEKVTAFRGIEETRLIHPAATPAPTNPETGRRVSRRALTVATIVGVVTGGLAAAGVALLVSGGETAAPRTVTEVRQTGPATQAPTLAGLTPFDRQLLPHVPDGLRAGCRHETPLTADFDATLSCRPGEPVSSLTYSHARSGFLLYDYFLSHVREAGLPDTQPLTTGLCGAGDIPSVNHVAPRGLSGRVEMSQGVKREERLGSVLCQRPGEQFRIEWITNEVAVYAMATGTDLQALYDWWSRDGGPEP